MKLNRKELVAMIKATFELMKADGKIQDEELMALSIELTDFGVSSDQIPALLSEARKMETSTMFVILSMISPEYQKAIAGFWGVIIMSDEHVDKSEVAMWALLCSLSSFPKMTVEDALSAWATNK